MPNTAPRAPTPTIAATKIATSRAGNATVRLMNAVSILPSRSPASVASAPSAIPSAAPIPVAMSASTIDSRAATRTRSRMSRPSASVPSGCSRLAPWDTAVKSNRAASSAQSTGPSTARATTAPTPSTATSPTGVRRT